jgi:hypothetical protein
MKEYLTPPNSFITEHALYMLDKRGYLRWDSKRLAITLLGQRWLGLSSIQDETRGYYSLFLNHQGELYRDDGRLLTSSVYSLTSEYYRTLSQAHPSLLWCDPYSYRRLTLVQEIESLLSGTAEAFDYSDAVVV